MVIREELGKPWNALNKALTTTPTKEKQQK
jgi:hypothetical protein